MPEPHSPFDNGTTWKFKAIQLPFASNESSGAFSVASRTNNLSADLVVVGGDYSHPSAAGFAVFLPGKQRLIFGTKSMTAATTPPHGFRSAVAYDAPTKTWITVGPNGTDISTDDGRNWHPLTPSKDEPADADKHWNALSLPYVVGPHGRIATLNPSALAPASK